MKDWTELIGDALFLVALILAVFIIQGDPSIWDLFQAHVKAALK